MIPLSCWTSALIERYWFKIVGITIFVQIFFLWFVQYELSPLFASCSMQCSIKKFFVLGQSVSLLTEESKGQTNLINYCPMTDYLGQNSCRKRLKTFQKVSVKTLHGCSRVLVMLLLLHVKFFWLDWRVWTRRGL